MIQKIHLVKDEEEINRLYEFIKKFPLNYPNYSSWLEKCKREIELGYKKAFVCEYEGKIVANLIFQPHKEDPYLLELKNSRVEGDYRRRKIFSCMIKGIIKYANENKFKKIITDTHSNNEEVIKTLKNLGFVIESHENLYDSKVETVLVKDLTIKPGRLDLLLMDVELKLSKILESLLYKLKFVFILKNK